MTLTPVTPEEFDALALRLLDVAAALRTMGQAARFERLETFELHTHKLREWLERLESWTVDARGRVAAQTHRQRGARRAAQVPALPPESEPVAAAEEARAIDRPSRRAGARKRARKRA